MIWKVVANNLPNHIVLHDVKVWLNLLTLLKNLPIMFLEVTYSTQQYTPVCIDNY